MTHFLLKAGVAACALALLGFTAQANATPRLTLNGPSSLTILAGDEENSEVENLLDPAQDNGTPRDETGPAEAAPQPYPEGADVMAPHAKDGDGEVKEIQEEYHPGD